MPSTTAEPRNATANMMKRRFPKRSAKFTRRKKTKVATAGADRENLDPQLGKASCDGCQVLQHQIDELKQKLANATATTPPAAARIPSFVPSTPVAPPVAPGTAPDPVPLILTPRASPGYI